MHSPYGLHRVITLRGVLPQQAWRLDVASFRQLREEHGDGVRAAVLAIVAERGKLQNPVTGSGGMLLGIVRAAGELSPLGLSPDQRVATLVSLTLTPLRITDGLRRWDGRGEQVPCEGTAVLFGRSIAAVLPEADGGTVAFFSMATSFTAAALGAEGLATDVELLIGNGYAPGHAALAMELVRTHQGVRALIEDTETCSQGRHVNTAHP